jgi:hypothetical protein
MHCILLPPNHSRCIKPYPVEQTVSHDTNENLLYAVPIQMSIISSLFIESECEINYEIILANTFDFVSV